MKMAKANGKKDKPSAEFKDNQENQTKAYKSKRFTVGYVNSTQFYQLPKFLFFGELKTKLSNNAKVLYALLKDRNELSAANGWYNDEQQVYIIFTREEMREMLGNVSKTTIKNVVEELKQADLIDEIQQGLNKPNIIYVKYIEQGYVDDLITQEKVNKEELYEKHLQAEVKQREYKETYKRNRAEARKRKKQGRLGDKTETVDDDNMPEVQKMDFQENEKAGSPENGLPGSPKNGLPEVQKLDPNNTDIYNKTYPNNKTDIFKEIDESIDVPSILPSTKKKRGKKVIDDEKKKQAEKDRIDRIDKVNNIKKYEELIKSNIDYDILVYDSPKDKSSIDEIVEVMVQIMTDSDDMDYSIRGSKVPAAIVKSRFMKVDSEIMKYILWSLEQNTTEIKDIFKYLVSTIYNAPATMNNWIQLKVNYDMAHDVHKK